jgi:hypothetical protein
MKLPTSRGRLLAGAALGLGLTVVTAQPAQAACTIAAPLINCSANTTTTDTTFPTNPGFDRNVDYSVTGVVLDVDAGVLVDGFGLALTDVGAPAGTDTIVTNDGTIRVNVGNTPTAGGLDGALGLTSVDVDYLYSGTGDIENLGTGDGLEVLITGTGTFTGTIGGSVRADTGDAIAIDATNVASGPISVTTTAGETVRASQGDGIEIDTAGSGAVTVVNNAAISSGGDGVNTLVDGISVASTGTGSIAISGNGAIGTAGDRAQGDGISASITNAASAGNVTITTGTGGVFNNLGEGVEGSTTGTGNVAVTIGAGGVNSTAGIRGVSAVATTGTATIVTNGAVTTGGVGAAGLYANTTTGAVSITNNAAVTAAGAGSAGIAAYSTTGPIAITVNGNVTGDYGIYSDSGGARTITVTAGDTVDGNTQAAIHLLGAGTAAISNSGTIGGVSTDVAVNAAGAGATTLTNNAAGTINGRLTLSGFADTFTNNGTWNTQGITDFGAGVDALSNTATGIVNLTGATTLANLETFNNAGRINLNTFTLTGPAIAFTNAGTIDTSGNAGLAGFTSFNNAGILDLAAGTFTVPAAAFTNSGTILADEGASTITGQTSFANTGTIDLQDGAVGDVLTINSNFVGSGGSNLDVDFTGTASDRLVITGAASGTTTVDAAYLGGGFNLDGVLVVDTAASTPNAFVLGAVTGLTPLVDVNLVQAGADYFLTAAPTLAAFDPLAVPVFAGTLWYQSADEVFAETVKPATTSGFSFWGEGYYHDDKFDNDTDPVIFDGAAFDADIYELDMKRYGIQMGADYGFDGGGRVGLTAGYAWANADNDSDLGLDVKGWNLGIYGQFGGVTGFHGEFLFKHDRYDAEFDDGAFDGEEFDIKSTGIDGSLGYRFGFGGMTLDAHAGISHVWTKIDDVEAFGFEYDIKKLTSTRGRAGLRAIFGEGGMAPYVDGTVYREFDGDGEVELFDGVDAYDLETQGRGTWVRVEAGISGNDGPGPILAAWGDFGDRKGLGLRAGWRFGGGRVAEALPPPPPPVVAPPPPPPPATPTCPDGSVILATDACPPPPPPPPPPPEPERG